MTLEFAYVRIDMPLHLDSNPKTDRAVAYYPFYSIVTIVHNQHKNAITKVPDGYGMKLLALWLRKNQIIQLVAHLFLIERYLTVVGVFSEPDDKGKCYQENTN
jgi:hypothetical protein